MDREELALEYLEQIPFEPYPFQEEAIFSWFSSEQGVLVCAPTGMGKTLIAEAGLFEAVKTGKRAYYTTPLIALTEQKYREIQDALDRWGFDHNMVGLITGNRRVNPEAPILVVVAEILFNRLLHQNMFRGSQEGEPWMEFDPAFSELSDQDTRYDRGFSELPLEPNNPLPMGADREKNSRSSRSAVEYLSKALSFDDVSVVVMDEFHNFADYERGIVWEFSLELLPSHVRTLLISATVGNAYEFVSWLRNTSGRKLGLVQSSQRKVPLTYQWVGEELLVEHLEKMHQSQHNEDDSRLTPALVFCFDRSECWEVAEQIRGRDVITTERQKKISGLLEQYDFTQGAGPKIKQLLLRGVGVHHAGILPKYRRIIEDLFQQKLLSICVCTETLAAGINLPARSVVLPTLLKGPPGEKKLIDSSSAHQIFGRAGRPQYDTQGFVFALAHEDDVKITRFKAKYEQIPEDTKDPKLREMKKKLKKKMPTRRSTEQYWVESHFLSLQKSSPGNLVSRGEFPWRMLAHIIVSDPDIATIRTLVGRRLMGAKRLQRAQKELDHQLLTLWKGGYIQLDPDPKTFGIEGPPLLSFSDENPGKGKNTDTKSIVDEKGSAPPHLFGLGIFEDEEMESSAAGSPSPEPTMFSSGAENEKNAAKSPIESLEKSGGKPEREEEKQPEDYVPLRAYPTEKLPDFLKLRGINPLYGLFMLRHFAIADRCERIQILESVLELPSSIGRYVRVPRQNEMPPGPLAMNRLDSLLLDLGLASVDELVEKTEEEKKEEWEQRRRFGGLSEEPVFVLKLAEKMHRLFEYEYPGVRVKIHPVWAAGDILLEFQGDFNKYITSNALQKQEGIIFRHLLRLILLLEELSELVPPGLPAEDWKEELSQLGEMLVKCCRKVDPSSTEETLHFSQTRSLVDAM